MNYRPIVLIILDGVGVNPMGGESPFVSANLPTFRALEANYVFTTLRASGAAVGLPWGEEGNSEVGHLTIGSGRIIYHHLPRIINAIQDGSFFENTSLLKAVQHVKEKKSVLHIMGLFSSGSVHAYVDHLYALLELAERQGVEQVMVHIFTDGRDAPVNEAAKFLADFQERMEKEYPHAVIASVIGRHFSMDRDGNWDRTETCYRLLTEGSGNAYTNAAAYVNDMYAKNITDEFVEPGFLSNGAEGAIGRIKDGDAVVYYDFREDSVRQLTTAFLAETFKYFSRIKLQNLVFVTMTEYDKVFPAEVAFSPLEISWPLSRVVSEAGLKQLHIAETEKYAHVTYFFNGGKEQAFLGEDRKLIPSPHAVSFNEHPEMAAEEITKTIIMGLETYDLIVANYANGDMVGHTGEFEATAKALEVLDTALSQVLPMVLEKGGVLLVTADHGNAEEKRYVYSGEPRTKHTTNPVPFYMAAKEFRRESPQNERAIKAGYKEIGGVLTDVAPTVLELMNLEKPGEMTGVSLLRKLHTR